jgi:hypothetical protein
MRSFALLFLVLFACKPASKTPFSPAAEENKIRTIMASQEKSWNEGNLDAFMIGYWQSDSLEFIGKRITHGWDSTLANYKRGYPDRATMGQLKFDLYQFRFMGTDACVVTGRYTLTRESDQPTGMFTLVWRKKSDEWVIVYDHSS